MIEFEGPICTSMASSNSQALLPNKSLQTSRIDNASFRSSGPVKPLTDKLKERHRPIILKRTNHDAIKTQDTKDGTSDTKKQLGSESISGNKDKLDKCSSVEKTDPNETHLKDVNKRTNTQERSSLTDSTSKRVSEEMKKVMDNINKDLSRTNKSFHLIRPSEKVNHSPLKSFASPNPVNDVKQPISKITISKANGVTEVNALCRVSLGNKFLQAKQDNSSNKDLQCKDIEASGKSSLPDVVVRPTDQTLNILNAEDLDDLSIDLTEEEEVALLQDNEAVDGSDTNLKPMKDTEETPKGSELSDQEWCVVDEVFESGCDTESDNESLIKSVIQLKNSNFSRIPSPDGRTTPIVADEMGRKTDCSPFEKNAGNLETETKSLHPLIPKDDSASEPKTSTLECNNNDDSLISEKIEDNDLSEKIEDNDLSEKIEDNDQGAKISLESTDADKTDSLLWNFGKNTDFSKSKDVLNEIPVFDNTAKEEGMQQAVDKVVQQILTEISPDGDSNDSLLHNLNKDGNVPDAVLLSETEKKGSEEIEKVSDSVSPNNKIIKRLLTSESSYSSEGAVKKLKECDQISGQDGSDVMETETTTPATTTEQEKEDLMDNSLLDSKRKRTSLIETDKSSETTGLTVKKIKLDSGSSKAEMKHSDSVNVNVKTKGHSSYNCEIKQAKVPKKLLKNEFEDLIARQMSHYFTENDRSEVGALKLKCEHLEKSLEIWRRRANAAQKQMVELQIAQQRMAHQNIKKVGSAQLIKVSTRTVGLQVQMHSFLVPEDKTSGRLPRPVGHQGVKMIPASAPASNTLMSNQDMSRNSKIPPTLTAKQIQALSPASRALSSAAAAAVAANMQSGGMVPGKLINNQALMKSTTNQTGVSILQPRITNAQPVMSNRSWTTASPGASNSQAVPKVASVIPPNTSTVRNLLDSRRVQASPAMSSSAHPVPMRLVPNQAAAKQASPNVRPAIAPAQPVQAIATSAAASVKIIDLTADEDENNATANQLIKTVVTVPTTTLATQTQSASTTTASGPKAVTLLTTPLTSSGQIIISPSPVKPAVSLPTGSTSLVRMDSNTLRPQPPPILPQAVGPVPPGARFTYLVPSTMVRTQPFFVTQTSQPRQLQPSNPTNLLRPPVQTILLQKGTALVPVQTPAPLANMLQPVTTTSLVPSIPSSSQRGASVSTTALPATNLTSASTTTLVSTLQSAIKSPTVQLTTTMARLPAPVVPTPASMEQSSGQAIVVSRIANKHPAPLPISTNKADSLPGLKSLPPKPALKISKVNNGIVLSWNMSLNATHAEILSYQLYAYQESSAPSSTSLWKKVGDVKALPLPMACTLTQFMEGHKYHFAVRAVDVHQRIGLFSDPGSIILGIGNASTPTGIRV